MHSRIWTLEEALEIFPEVKRITQDHYDRAMDISIRLANEILPENIMEEREDEARKIISDWARTIHDYGIEVKGLWLLDFDNGNGYYCWKLGEEELLYEHSYEEGFAGRKLIKRNKE